MADSAPKESKLCVRGNDIRKKFSLGVRRMALDDIGVSPFNRAVSWKHAYYVQKQIDTAEGFTRFRYKEAIVLAPDPKDSESVFRHTRTICEAAGGHLAPPAPGGAMFGALTKNHLVLGLRARKHGGKAYEDGTPLKIPARNASTEELLDTLDHGVFVEVIGWGAVEEDLEAVRYISLMDNLDQAKAMPEHEMELVARVWRQSVNVTAQPGMTAFESVKNALLGKTAGSWGEDDLVWAFNFARSISETQLKCLQSFHFFHVNATVLRIEVAFFACLAECLALEYPWCRIALVVYQYMTPPDRPQSFVASGRGLIAKGVTHQSVEKLGKDAGKLAAGEALMRHYLEDVFRHEAGDVSAATNAVTGTVLTKMGEFLVGSIDCQSEKGRRALAKI